MGGGKEKKNEKKLWKEARKIKENWGEKLKKGNIKVPSRRGVLKWQMQRMRAKTDLTYNKHKR